MTLVIAVSSRIKIQSTFPGDLYFLSAKVNTPEDVINASTAELQTEHVSDKESCIRRAADYLRNDILSYCNGLSDISWPPSISELSPDI